MNRRQLFHTASACAFNAHALALPGPAVPSVWRVAPFSELETDALCESLRSSRWVLSQRAVGDPYEWRLQAPADVVQSRAYQPDVVGVKVLWQSPEDQTILSEGFWSEWPHFKGWVIRWTPPKAGLWAMQASLTIAGRPVTALGQVVTLKVPTVDTMLPIHISPRHPSYFADATGKLFFPVGINMAWASAPVLARYEAWFTQLAAAGGNMVRIWMSSWCFGLEWSETGLGQFAQRQDHAQRLDSVLSIAQSRGIRVMLCLLNHGAFSTKADSEWDSNPYNRHNGGPLDQPAEFFSNEDAIACFENRVRYIAARWSHSPALHSWEWWNEVTWVRHQPEDLQRWLLRMNRTLRTYDPYARLQTNSWADAGPMGAWETSGLDFAQQHDYTPLDLPPRYARASQKWREWSRVLPVVPGELGARSTQPTRDTEVLAVHTQQMHDGLWAPLMLGYASTALYWWWDHFVDATNRWYLLKPFSRWMQALHTSGIDVRTLNRSFNFEPKTEALAESNNVTTARLECWLRFNEHTLIGWVRFAGHIGGNGPLVPPISLAPVWVNSQNTEATTMAYTWTGECMQTNNLKAVPLTPSLSSDGHLNLEFSPCFGSAVFWLRRAEAAAPELAKKNKSLALY